MTTTLRILIWLAPITTTAVVLALLLKLPQRGLRRFLIVAASYGAMAIGWSLVIRPFRRSFADIHALYLNIVITLPVVGIVALLIWAIRRREGWLSKLDIAVLSSFMLLIPLGVYMTYIEPNRLVVERETVAINSQRVGLDIKVVLFGDLQARNVGHHEHQAIRTVMAQKPDVILIPGDFYQQDKTRSEKELRAMRTLVRKLHAPGGVWVTLGDTDDRYEFERFFKGTDINWLDDDVQFTTVRGRRLAIGGIDIGFNSSEAVDVVDELEEQPTNTTRLLVSHRPDVALNLKRDTTIDLVASGHTHGGQVQIPFLGPVITQSSVPDDVAAGGLHNLGGKRRIYVTRGVGMERLDAPPFRFGSVPEITVLTLR